MMSRSSSGREASTTSGVPTGVLVLGGLATASAVFVAVVLFGPNLPGPSLTEIFGEDEPQITACLPTRTGVTEPSEPIEGNSRWRQEPDLPDEFDELRAATVERQIYLPGGQTLTDGELVSLSAMGIYDADSQEFAEAPPAPTPVDHSGVVSYDGDVYVVGGDSNGVASGGVWRYSPEDDEWTTLASMNTPRAGHGAAVIEDKLYVVGGSTDAGFVNPDAEPLASVEIYDFELGEWSQGPNMPTARHHLGVAALDGALYAIGGREPDDFALDTVERLDPVSGAWEELPPLPLGSGGLAGVATSNEVVAISGSNDPAGWVTPATWAFDPQTEGWRRLADLEIPRHGHAAAVANGRIYVLGGAPCAGAGSTVRVESLDLAATRPGVAR